MTLKEQIQSLEAKATQGEWTIEHGYHKEDEGYDSIIVGEYETVLASCDGCSLGEVVEAQLICLLRNNAKEIVRSLQELEDLKSDKEAAMYAEAFDFEDTISDMK